MADSDEREHVGLHVPSRLRKLPDRFDGGRPKQMRIDWQSGGAAGSAPVRHKSDRWVLDLSVAGAAAAAPLASAAAEVGAVADTKGEDDDSPEDPIPESPGGRPWRLYQVGASWTYEPVAGWEAIGIHLPWNQHGALYRTEVLAEEAAIWCMGANP